MQTNLANVAFRRHLTQFGRTCVVALVMILVVTVFNEFKGYKVFRIGDDDYRIEVTMDRQRASELMRRMHNNLQSECSIRAICLPNGFLHSVIVSYEEVWEFWESGEESTTVIRYWRAAEHPSIEYEEGSQIYIAEIEISYQQIERAIASAKAEHTDGYFVRGGINLPNGEQGVCRLNLRELENYRRTMHVWGAKRVLIPFAWSLDNLTLPVGFSRVM